MTMVENKNHERLYLSKGDTDIYLDVCELVQHQIDGIRFLYRQLKKKKQGVIINDPPGYGKTLQVVSFLNAIQRFLCKPILIICKEHEISNWMEHFQRWTRLSDEILIRPPNSYCNQMKVCINPMSFGTREWSIVVVDEDMPSKDVLKAGLKAEYKIWITSIDMKANLQTFSLIYNWLYPKEKLDIKDFKANNHPKDIIAKSILMDAFMEDLVIRHNDLLTPFKVSEKVPKIIEGKPKVSINTKDNKTKVKNKDATGTKIKRSKIRLEDDVKAEQTDVDIETFIRDQEPIGSDAFKEYNMQDHDSTSRSSLGNKHKIGNFDFESTNESISNKKSKMADTKQSDFVEHSEEPNYHKEPTQETSIINLKLNTSKELYVSRQSDLLMEELVNEHSNPKSMESDLNNDLSVSTTDSNDFNISNHILQKKDTPECTVSDAEELNVDIESTNGNVLNNEIIKEDSKNEVNHHKSIDDIMKEMEEKALKKFKGSFLDSIF